MNIAMGISMPSNQCHVFLHTVKAFLLYVPTCGEVYLHRKIYQNLQCTLSRFLLAGTIWSLLHLGHVRLRPRIAPITPDMK